MKRWEYRMYVFERADRVVDRLNALGAEGWEAFYVERSQSGEKARWWFKREVPPA